jgi:hypothetical protein
VGEAIYLMHLNSPQSPTTVEAGVVWPCVLFPNELVPRDVTLDANDLAKIKTPNRDGSPAAIRFRASAPNPR